MAAGWPCSRLAQQMFLFLGTLLASFGPASSTAQVPLLMWSTHSTLPDVSSSWAGHITSSGQLASYLGSAFGNGAHTVLLFLQDKLSKDDFTAFAGVFGNKQDGAFPNLEALLRSSPSSLTFPAVAWTPSVSTATLLEEQLGVAPMLVDRDTLSRVHMDAALNNLLVINLPYCTSLHKSCQEVLRDNDATIADVVRTMDEKKVPYTAMYTGARPSRVISSPSTAEADTMGRSLLQAVVPDVKPPVIFNMSGSPCIMLWAENLNVSVSSTSRWTDLATESPSLTGSMCNATNALLVLGYPSGFTLRFAMSQRFYPVSARNWFTLDQVQLQFNGSTASFAGGRAISAPAEYSFRCGALSSSGLSPLLVPNSSDPGVADWRLNFIHLQIQGFGLSNGTDFSYASDCAGFFTPAIWMGLLTSLLLLAVFVYGLHMIMGLNTMDRFDDPKGPAISVPQSE